MFKWIKRILEEKKEAQKVEYAIRIREDQEQEKREKRERFLKFSPTYTLEQARKEVTHFIWGIEDWWQQTKTVVRPTDEELLEAIKTGKLVLKFKEEIKNLDIIDIKMEGEN